MTQSDETKAQCLVLPAIIRLRGALQDALLMSSVMKDELQNILRALDDNDLSEEVWDKKLAALNDGAACCPGCGKKPAVDLNFYRQVCVFCDSDDCSPEGDGNMQTMARTLKGAVELWNCRVANVRGKIVPREAPRMGVAA